MNKYRVIPTENFDNANLEAPGLTTELYFNMFYYFKPPEDHFSRISRASSEIFDLELFYYVWVILQGPSGIHQHIIFDDVLWIRSFADCAAVTNATVAGK